VLQGTLDMLVLKALQLEPMHGWGITERIEQWSERVLQLGQGTLYPALYRLERQGLIRSEWRMSRRTTGAPATTRSRPRGRRHLGEELPTGGACRGRSTSCSRPRWGGRA
jgi:PadR family transcriptional regulator, regulatory protein PadR